MLLTRTCRPIARSLYVIGVRPISTLSNNPHIYVFPSNGTYILSFLPTNPPNRSLVVGTTTELPPTPSSLAENPRFLKIVDEVFSKHAVHDPELQIQASAYASVASSGLTHPSPSNSNAKRARRAQATAAGDATNDTQTAPGRGGWIHVSDSRNPPDYGRIAWPEDIFGSLEVDATGSFVADGNWQSSGTYRMVTRDGIIGMPNYLRGKLVERLRELERGESQG